MSGRRAAPTRRNELRRVRRRRQQLDLDPHDGPAGPGARPQGGRARRQAGEGAHDRVGRARRAAARRAARAPTPRACPGSTGSSTPCATQVGLEDGVALPVWDALRRGRRRPPHAGAEGGRGIGDLPAARGPRRDAAREAAPRAAGGGHPARSTRTAATRERADRQVRRPAPTPWIYLIVATGDIYEDIPQAQAAAREGADVIAVIRSTGQSLLDYVPEGATREGYAGTYATQENFRLMRAALDETSARSSAATSG